MPVIFNSGVLDAFMVSSYEYGSMGSITESRYRDWGLLGNIKKLILKVKEVGVPLIYNFDFSCSVNSLLAGPPRLPSPLKRVSPRYSFLNRHFL